MTPGQARIDLQIAKSELFSLFDRVRTRDGFASRSKNICTGLFAETREVCDLVGMRVGEENQTNIQFVVLREPNHFLGISAGIEGRRDTVSRVPDEVRVNGHAVIIGVELRETIERFDFLWMPFALRKFPQGSAVQAKNRRNAQQRRFIEIAVAQLAYCLRSDTSFFGQFRIGNAQA